MYWSANTSPLAFGFHADTTAPEEPFTSARFLRLVPPTEENEPPRYTLLPTGWIARTVPLTFGAQESRLPVVRLIAATWLRVTSPVPDGSPAGRTEVNWPPM